ncbi:MAG TPA: alpha/beta hydrolase [Caulobacteraceae bacterium]
MPANGRDTPRVGGGPADRRPSRRKLAGILKWLALLTLLAAPLGFLYSQVGLELDARLAPPKREMFMVDGHAVHVVCTGRGPPTFVIDSGLGGWSIYSWRIQPLLARLGRTCSFDRPGLGWSDASNEGHDGIAAADQLERIVKAAHIPTPFVYVGLSFGANLAPIYYSRYPRDVSALVLMEPDDPKQMLKHFRGTRRTAMAAADCGLLCQAAGVAGELGLTRVRAQTAGTDYFRGDALAQIRAGFSRPDWIKSLAAYFVAGPKIAYEDLDVTSFGDTPVLVLASPEMRGPEWGETAAEVKASRPDFLRYLSSLAAASSRGVGPIVIPNSTHMTMTLGRDQAKEVVRYIREFVSRWPDTAAGAGTPPSTSPPGKR